MLPVEPGRGGGRGLLLLVGAVVLLVYAWLRYAFVPSAAVQPDVVVAVGLALWLASLTLVRGFRGLLRATLVVGGAGSAAYTLFWDWLNGRDKIELGNLGFEVLIVSLAALVLATLIGGKGGHSTFRRTEK